LREIEFSDQAEPFAWAVQMDQWFKARLTEKQIQTILDYKTSLQDWQRGIPTEEHLQPLFVILGMISDLGYPQEFAPFLVETGYPSY